jgi:DNA-binding response OmpR family regulator
VDTNPLKLNILVVDDDKDLAAIMKLSLKKKHEVYLSHTLDEARSCMCANCIHLLLLDNRLPDGSGLDFIPEIRQKYPDAKIVMLSADIPLYVEKPAIAAGARGFISKPFDVHIIDNMIISLFRADL